MSEQPSYLEQSSIRFHLGLDRVSTSPNTPSLYTNYNVTNDKSIGRRLALTVPVCLHLLCRVSRHFGDRRGKERKSALVLEDVAMTLCVKGSLYSGLDHDHRGKSRVHLRGTNLVALSDQSCSDLKC